MLEADVQRDSRNALVSPHEEVRPDGVRRESPTAAMRVTDDPFHMYVEGLKVGEYAVVQAPKDQRDCFPPLYVLVREQRYQSS